MGGSFGLAGVVKLADFRLCVQVQSLRTMNLRAHDIPDREASSQQDSIGIGSPIRNLQRAEDGKRGQKKQIIYIGHLRHEMR